MDVMGTQPADQINADPGTTAFQQFLAGTGSMLSLVGRRRIFGAHLRQVGRRRCGRLLDPAGLGRCLQLRRPANGTRCHGAELCAEHGLYRLGRLRDGRASTATRRSTRRPGLLRRISAARTSPCGCRPIRRASSLTATPTSSTTNGKRQAMTGPISRTISARTLDSYNHPNAAIEPRIPGIFQYYSVAEDELAKGFAGQYGSAPGNRRRHCRGLGEDHRPDRPRQPDRALQGVAGDVSGLQ